MTNAPKTDKELAAEILAEPSFQELELRRKVAALEAVARAYEAWEADVILNGDWSRETVRLTQAHHDRLIEIQAMRNAALSIETTL